MKLLHAAAILVCAVMFSSPLWATTIHVDDNAPNDPGPGNPAVSDPLEDGSPDHPFDAIQEGVDASPLRYGLLFDGVDDGMRIPSLAVNASSGTFEAWVKLDSPQGQTWTHRALFDARGDTPDPGQYDVIYVGARETDVELWMTGGVRATYPGSSLQAGVWYHIAATWDIPNRQFRVYINGTGGPVGTDDVGVPDVTHAFVGRVYDPALYGDRFWDGVIDEIRVWDHARTEAQIKDMMGQRLTGSEPGLIAYLPLDEGTAQDAFDLTGNGNDGELGETAGADDSDPSWTRSYAPGERDTVLVAAGTYRGDGNRDIDFLGRAIAVKSASGAGTCLIDCEATPDEPHRGFRFRSGEGPDSVVEGFTVANGCTAGEFPDNCGGAVLCLSSSPSFIGCAFTGNWSARFGGGVYCTSSSAGFSRCRVAENTAADDGGGMRCDESALALRDCVISRNLSAARGGGVFCADSSILVQNCLLVGNNNHNLFVSHSPAVVENSTFSGSDGAAIRCWGSDATPMISNSILWGDAMGEILLGGVPATPVVACSDVQGGWPGTGNISADPLFMHGPLHEYYLRQIAAGEFPDSPCVDAGSDTAANLGLDALITRTDGIPDEGVVDMGYHAPYALRIYRVVAAGDDICIFWSVRVGVSYVVEWSVDHFVWNEVAVGAVESWTDVGVLTGTPAGSHRYYRVREESAPPAPGAAAVSATTRGAETPRHNGGGPGATRPTSPARTTGGPNVRGGGNVGKRTAGNDGAGNVNHE